VNLHIPIFDGHNDTLLRLFASKPNDSFFDSTQGHIDLVRARAGGFAGGFFAVFVPSAPDEQPANDDDFPEQLPFAYALETSLAMTALLFRIEAQPPVRCELRAQLTTSSTAYEPTR
jgi:membrane dipeptidase